MEIDVVAHKKTAPFLYQARVAVAYLGLRCEVAFLRGNFVDLGLVEGCDSLLFAFIVSFHLFDACRCVLEQMLSHLAIRSHRIHAVRTAWYLTVQILYRAFGPGLNRFYLSL